MDYLLIVEIRNYDKLDYLILKIVNYYLMKDLYFCYFIYYKFCKKIVLLIVKNYIVWY